MAFAQFLIRFMILRPDDWYTEVGDSRPSPSYQMILVRCSEERRIRAACTAFEAYPAC
ncbi:MAG: hypothetical protein ACR2IK_14880 [Chloroflexota bacterium]